MVKFKFKVKTVDLSTGGKSIVVLNEADARDLNIDPMDRVRIVCGKRETSAVVDTTESYIKKGHLGAFEGITNFLKLKNNQEVFIEPIERPESIHLVRKKMDGVPLQKDEMFTIIHDIMKNNLSDVELTAFVTALYMKGLSHDEILYFTNAVLDSGETISLKTRPIMDKHCIGGVPGNPTTMLIVPIVAAAGLTIPKTSSKSITSPAGTADVMEVLAPVALTKEKIEEVVNKTKGCITWGGAVNLAAADDKLIRIRRPLSLDPRGVLLASILAKKKAVGATHVLIDIPVGKGAKIFSKKEAEDLAKDFMDLGMNLDMEVHCIITPGHDPVGAAVGPALEARETMRILYGEKVSMDLVEKSLVMAGILLELGRRTKPGNGKKLAHRILGDGRALQKMKEIIKAQGGDPNIKPENIKVGKYKANIFAEEEGRIYFMNTRDISIIARAAGAPKDKKAGVYLYAEKGDKIKKGQKLFTIYAESKRKLEDARGLVSRLKPVEMSRIVLEKLSTETKPYVFDVK